MSLAVLYGRNGNITNNFLSYANTSDIHIGGILETSAANERTYMLIGYTYTDILDMITVSSWVHMHNYYRN